MTHNSLIEKTGIRIRLGDYCTASATMLRDPSILPKVQDYRRLAGARMYPLDRHDISRKIASADYHVSRKIDGEFTVFCYDVENAFSVNPGGTVRMGLAWQQQAARLLEKAGIRQAMIAGELYRQLPDRRCRVHDVLRVVRQPSDRQQLDSLRLAVFDVIELNGQRDERPFPERVRFLQETFGEGALVAPVEWKQADSAREIEKIFRQWVEDEGDEGIVVRCDVAGTYKIKPRHTLDAAVIGFTESTEDRTGMMHDLLLAMVRNDGALQVLCRVGGGFTDDQRREMLSDLKDMVVSSEYAEVNSDHVAYQMVKPQWVVEISCLDLIAETTRGAPVNRMVLHWNAGQQQYEVIRRLPLASVISPQFVRTRDDKNVNPQDVRIDQIARVVEVPLADRDATQMILPKSEVLRREVYTKQLKGQTMVRKFMMWKTNKESESAEFPAYVLHYTDFSPNRKVPLSREVRVSNSESRMEAFWVAFKEQYIKQGWSRAGASDESRG
jgi:hypothetical protein